MTFGLVFSNSIALIRLFLASLYFWSGLLCNNWWRAVPFSRIRCVVDICVESNCHLKSLQKVWFWMEGELLLTQRGKAGWQGSLLYQESKCSSLKTWPQFHVSHFLAKWQPNALCSHREETALFYTKIKLKGCLAQAEQCLCRQEKSPDASEEMKAITRWEGYAAQNCLVVLCHNLFGSLFS